jgi:hypothetical protein
VTRWLLTSRHGSRVARRAFDNLDAALEAVRDEAVAVVRDGPLEPIQGFREYDPADRVAARFALKSGGILSTRAAGLDVMGDGTLVPFAGAFRRRPLAGSTPDAALAAMREALA